MNLLDSPIQAATVTASALLAAVIGLLALLRRGHWLTTLLFSSAFLRMAAFEAGTLGIAARGQRERGAAVGHRTWRAPRRWRRGCG